MNYHLSIGGECKCNMSMNIIQSMRQTTKYHTNAFSQTKYEIKILILNGKLSKEKVSETEF